MTNLKKHVMTHTGCKTSSPYWKLKLKYAHSSLRPYKCVRCSKGFFNNKDLCRHMVVHSEKRPFKCSICSPPFKSKDHQRHMGIHGSNKNVKKRKNKTKNTKLGFKPATATQIASDDASQSRPSSQSSDPSRTGNYNDSKKISIRTMEIANEIVPPSLSPDHQPFKIQETYISPNELTDAVETSQTRAGTRCTVYLSLINDEVKSGHNALSQPTTSKEPITVINIVEKEQNSNFMSTQEQLPFVNLDQHESETQSLDNSQKSLSESSAFLNRIESNGKTIWNNIEANIVDKTHVDLVEDELVDALENMAKLINNIKIDVIRSRSNDRKDNKYSEKEACKALFYKKNLELLKAIKDKIDEHQQGVNSLEIHVPSSVMPVIETTQMLKEYEHLQNTDLEQNENFLEIFDEKCNSGCNEENSENFFNLKDFESISEFYDPINLLFDPGLKYHEREVSYSTVTETSNSSVLMFLAEIATLLNPLDSIQEESDTTLEAASIIETIGQRQRQIMKHELICKISMTDSQEISS